ncbi:hypothetical protein [Brevibacillus sp. NRS-1366]|uniref:hypothetical protein n=1 Tax=Brevibacillus sp. NRS-1366 TaxID=3233899 RepID=UPI003D1CB6DD
MSQLSTEVQAKETHEKAIGYFRVAEQYGYKFIMEVKKIRDERYYKQLGYSRFDDYCEMVWKVRRDFMDQRIQIATTFSNEEEFADLSRQLGHKKSLLLARTEEQIRNKILTEQSLVPSTGEQKTVEEMTVKELQEVEKALKEAQQKAANEQRERQSAELKVKQLENELKNERNKEPSIVEKEVIKTVEIDKTDYAEIERLKRESKEKDAEVQRYVDQVGELESERVRHEEAYTPQTRMYLKRKGKLQDLSLEFVDQIKMFSIQPPLDLPEVYRVDYLVMLESLIKEASNAYDAMNNNQNKNIIDVEYTTL